MLFRSEHRPRAGEESAPFEAGARLKLGNRLLDQAEEPFEIALVPAGSLKVSRRLKLEKDAAEVQRAMGFQNEKDHPEVAPSQFEINYGYGEVVSAADQIQLYKLICRQVANSMGLTASFLPKPVVGVNGSGMHTNVSVMKGGKNIFWDPKGEEKISKYAWEFVDRILTSGGDCAGLNAVIRAVALCAHHGHGWKTVGIRYGTLGLLERPVAAVDIEPNRLDAGVARRGGTFLGSTNRGDPFAFPMEGGRVRDRSGEMLDGLRSLALDGLIGIGGDGSLAILRRLLQPIGLAFVGIPKTIDNDVAGTDRAIGHSTAVAVATEALDRLQPTGASHDRIMVLEVMGRDAGHIAIATGIAGGADVILIPEIGWRLANVTRHVQNLRAGGRRTALVVVAEAAGNSDDAPDPADDAGVHGSNHSATRREPGRGATGTSPPAVPR